MDLLAAAVMGALVNWLRAPKAWPNWLAYVIALPVAAVLYFVLNGDWVPALQADWRKALEPFAVWFAAGIGIGRVGKETKFVDKVMPKTGSIG